MLYEDYINVTEDQKQSLRSYGENLTKLLFVMKLQKRTTNVLKSIFMANEFKMKNPLLDFYENVVKAGKVLNHQKHPIDFAEIERIYQNNLVRIVHKLKETVLLPKISLNMADKH